MSEVATDTIWRGDTSMYSTSSGGTSSGSPNTPAASFVRQSTRTASWNTP